MKLSPTVTRTTKKGESPVVSSEISETSPPRPMKRVGSGEKGTPTGTPAELITHDFAYARVRE